MPAARTDTPRRKKTAAKKKTTARKTTARKTTAKEPAARKAALPQGAAGAPRARKSEAAARRHEPLGFITAEERWRMVAEAAYLRAEKRGFSGGDPVEDWLLAEREIEALIGRPSAA